MTSQANHPSVRHAVLVAIALAATAFGACASDFVEDGTGASSATAHDATASTGDTTATETGASISAGTGLDPQGAADCNPTMRGLVPPPNPPVDPPSSCVAEGTIKSVASGDWSSPATWDAGRVPEASDVVAIQLGHTVSFDVATARVAGVHVACQSTLRFAPGASATLESSGNVIDQGLLAMLPGDASVQHVLRFVDVDEEAFVGSTMDPVGTDVGLWVTEAGRLELEGTPKTSWTNLEASAIAGDTSITVADAIGWQVGDEILIVPTETPTTSPDWNDQTNTPDDPFAEKFERRTITSVRGDTVTLADALAHDHREVAADGGPRWTAEVANLSRNVRLEGTEAGRSHVFVRSRSAQLVRYVGGRHLGPRQGTGRSELVLGRYGLHFHHAMKGSVGSIVEGNAFADLGNRVYVAHMSDGVIHRCNVSFNTPEESFWWDFQDRSHDTVWDRNLVALTRYNGINNGTTGMLLGQGDGNVATNNVVVYGHLGDPHARGGFEWMADNEGVWVFKNNLAHSNVTGLNVWQNTSNNHTIDGFDSYANVAGIFHGAYGNAYVYTGGYHYDSPVEINAASGNSYGAVFKGTTFDAAGRGDHAVIIQDSPITSVESNKLVQCDFKGYAVSGLHLRSLHPFGHPDHMVKHVDIIDSTFSGVPYDADVPTLRDGNWIRLQPASGQAVRSEMIDGQWVTTDIAPFAPHRWGTGIGLRGEYFEGAAFERLKVTRIDSMVMFQQWSFDEKASPDEVHHLISGDAFSVRWTGKIEAQESTPYRFRLHGGGGFRLWVDGQPVIDDWAERADAVYTADSAPIDLVAGQKADIRIEHMNQSGGRSCLLYWQTPSMGGDRWEIVPVHQLYPE